MPARRLMPSLHRTCTSVLSLISVLAVSPARAQETTPDGPRLFGQVMGAIAGRYVDSTPVDSLYRMAAYGLVSQLGDPYAELVSPEELARFNVQVAGRYAGVGLLLEDHEGQFTVMKVFPGSPGERGGVMEGDQVVSVDGQATAGMKFQDVTSAMKGTPGTNVKVGFHRSGVNQPLVYTFERAVVHIPGVPFAIMLDGGVGYIPLQQFTEQSATEMEAAMRRLLASGARAFILDLRGDGGGYTDQALRIANLFLPKNDEVYQVRTRDPEPEVYLAPAPPLVPRAPLIVLVDGNTASASEIVAGALQDHDRGLVLGTTSFGKGLVQTAMPLQGGWMLKFTTGRWLTPSGRSIQRPRKLGSDGQLEDVPMDTSLAARPVFKSNAGRTIYGGGGIFPDIVVRPDTLTDAERRVQEALAPFGQSAYLALYDLAVALRPGLTPNFTYKQAWREEYWQRLVARGVTINREVYDAGASYIDRMIEYRVARVAFGDSTAARHILPRDRQLREALSLAAQGQTQPELYTKAGS